MCPRAEVHDAEIQFIHRDNTGSVLIISVICEKTPDDPAVDLQVRS